MILTSTKWGNSFVFPLVNLNSIYSLNKCRKIIIIKVKMLYRSYNEITTFESHRLPISCSTETNTEETSKFDCPSTLNFLLLAEAIFTGISSSISKINHVKRKKERNTSYLGGVIIL